MELVCEKYKEKLGSQNVQCQHPTEYCKIRTSCIIHFMGHEESVEEATRNSHIKDTMIPLRFEKGDGLLPAIAQDFETGEVLMLAYINVDAWHKTLETGKAHYWSRSRNKLWLKGESSKHYQVIKEILVDCDEDAIIYKVEQLGGAACHTGYRSCFYRRVEDNKLKTKGERIFDPAEVYKK